MSRTGNRALNILSRLAAFVACAIFSVSNAQTPPAEKSALRLVYFGNPGSARETDFLNFLQKYFKNVTSSDLARFDETLTAKADVVLLDYDGDGFKAPRVQLPKGYDCPTITIGVAGAFVCSNNRLKTGYL